jgi:hypothetical protein
MVNDRYILVEVYAQVVQCDLTSMCLAARNLKMNMGSVSLIE